MANLVNLETISLKNSLEVNEDMIQKYIFNDTKVLGLGDLTPIMREKKQPSGGRIDALLEDESGTRYEVEIQLGATDPSHIIRTIEYWDVERKRYPQYDHCAVIVAEEITGRFMNVISLFNGSIPLIALKLSAYKNGDNISLVFTKIIDRLTFGTDAEESYEETNRNYWESRVPSKMLKLVDSMHKTFCDLISGYDLNYNKFYIGLAKRGVSKNFVYYIPRKNFLYFYIKSKEMQEYTSKLEQSGLEAQYITRENSYEIRINSIDDVETNYDLLKEMITSAKNFYNIND